MRQSRRVLLLVLFVAVAFAGCSGDSRTYDPTTTVSGNVTIGDKPLESGTIAFEGADDVAKGVPTPSAEIKGGKYEMKASFGSKTVRITSDKETGKTDDTGLKLTEQMVAAEFNTKSKLTANVEKDGENKFDFSVKLK